MYERFLMLLEENNCKTADVARKTKIHPSTFSDWKKGKSSPKYDKIQIIADYFGVEADWLAGKSEFKTKKEMLQHFDNKTNLERLQKEVKDAGDVVDISDELYTPIKLLGEVAAGVPIHAQEDVIGYEYIPKDWKYSADYIGLSIKGDSMSPRILDGDTVIVRLQNDAESGDVVIVNINGDTATCKKLMKYADGISLISFNPAYEPMTFSNKEIEEKPVRIIGKVIENRSKF